MYAPERIRLRILWRLLVTSGLLLGGGTAFSVSGRIQAQLLISLAPTSGPPGTAVTVTGVASSTAAGEIHWDSLTGPLLGTFQPNPNGAFTTSVTIPANAGTGNHTIWACQYCQTPGRPPITASAPFAVTGTIRVPTQVIVLPTPRPTACDSRGVPGETVLDFEGFPVGTRLDGVTVEPGIRFIRQHELVVFQPRVATHSPTHALLNDFAGREFGSINIPIRIGFDYVQDFVGVFVGLNEQIWADEPFTATLTAYGIGADGHRTEVGRNSATLGPAATPIRVCLSVEAPGQIVEVTIEYTGPGGVAEPEVIDDLILRGPETPVPVPGDDLAPVVHILRPEDGETITDPYPRLEGEIAEDRLLSRVEVWLNGTRYLEIGASPAGYTPEGDRRYLFAVDPIPASAMRACADNTIEVRAFDAAGNQGSDAVTVRVFVGDLALTSAEPVQALYGAPLVRGKGTAFRVRVTSTYACEVETRLRLELPPDEWNTTPPHSALTGVGIPHAYEFPDSWAVHVPANAVDHEIMLPVVGAGEEAAPWSPEHPEGLIMGGSFRGIYGPNVRSVPRPRGESASFAVQIDPDRLLAETDEGNNRLSQSSLPVFDTRPIRMVFVPWLFELDAGALETESDYEYYLRESGYTDVASRMDAVREALDHGRVPLNVALSAEDIQRLQREARRYVGFFLGSFPVADEEISFRLYDYMYFQAEYLESHGRNLCHDWSWAEDVNALMSSTYPDTDVVILFRVMGCCGQSPGVYVDAGLELTGSPPKWHHLVANVDLQPDDENYYCWNWTFPLEGAAEYVIGHELNHRLMGYAGECYACTDPSHTDVSCAYCTIDADGFWVNQWMPFEEGSPYFSHSVCDGCLYWNRLEPSRTKYGGANPDGYRNAVRRLAPITDPEVLMIRGDVLRSGEVILDSFLVLPEGTLDLQEGSPGAYQVVLVGEGDQVLGSWGFDVSFMVYGPPPSLPRESDRAHFLHRVEWLEGVERIEIRDAQGTVLASRQVSAASPQVRLLAPSGGETWTAGRTYTIRWQGSDPDGDPLLYSLAYSPDGGETWVPLDMDLTSAEYRLKTHGWAEGTEYLIRVTATDGVRTTSAVSDAPFAVKAAAELPIPLPVLIGAALLGLVGVGLIGYAVWARRKVPGR